MQISAEESEANRRLIEEIRSLYEVPGVEPV